MSAPREPDVVLVRWVFLSLALACAWAGLVLAPISWLLAAPCAAASGVFLCLWRLL